VSAAVPRKAIVLSAGLGLRMRPLTDTMPKALIEVGGRPMIDRALSALQAAGVERAVVNVHHFADRMIRHLESWGGFVIVSDERALLMDSAGGVVKALPHLGGDPFLLLNADSFWIDHAGSSLDRLALAWDAAAMDILLMLSPLETATGHNGMADFVMDEAGRLARAQDRSRGFVYAGAAILHPRLFAGAPEKPFSLNALFDRALAAGRLFGVRMEGLWIHVGSPAAIAAAEAAIAESAA
jgi:N-acetyl-alpha-D-muramate 1-phosphate uridylyltransferase